MLTKVSSACTIIVILSLQATEAKRSTDNNIFNFNVLHRHIRTDQSDEKPQAMDNLSHETFNSHDQFIELLTDDEKSAKTFLSFLSSSKVRQSSNTDEDAESTKIKLRTRRSDSKNYESNDRLKRGGKNIPKFIRDKIKASNATSISRLLKCPKLRHTSRMYKPVCTRGRALFSRCEMKCKSGYYSPSPTSRKFRRCKIRTRNRTPLPQWTGRSSDFKCVPICDPPPKFEHGKFNCRIVGQDFECKFSCENDYKLWGSEKRKCISNTSWTGDPPYCTAVPTKSDLQRKMSIKFRIHQNFTCGDIKSLSSFTSNGIPHMIATDYSAGKVKIYKWKEGRFMNPPIQEIDFFGPMKAVVLKDPKSTTWLMVANSQYMTFYRLLPDGLFTRSHSNDSSLVLPQTDGSIQKKDAIAFAELRGEIYRCYGRNRRESPFVVVQKLQGARRKSGKKSVFHRIMRKRLSDEYVQRCSMYADGGSIYTIVALNKNDGRGRIIIGEGSHKKRGMKVVTVISGENLQNLSDAYGFSTSDGNRYIVASKNSRNGQCLVYKREWKTTE